MNSPSMGRLFGAAAAALALLLAAAPVLVAREAPAGQAAGEKIDLNTANRAALENLPGVDSAMAEQIIAGRPYTSVADLSKAGIPADTIERITPLVKVGPLGRAAATTGKAAQKAAAGVGRGADATAKGVDKGVGAASKGVQTGATATASTAAKVDRALTGAPRKPPQAGMVWADTATKIYHTAGDPLYGATKTGKWLTREEAAKEGYRAVEPPATKK